MSKTKENTDRSRAVTHVKPYWKHLSMGQELQVVDQSRVDNTIMVLDRWPDGSVFQVTLQIVRVTEVTP